MPKAAQAPSAALARNAEAGGSVGNLPSQLGSCGGAAPQKLSTVNVVHFYFLFVIARELGALPKIVGQIRGVFLFSVGVTLDPGRRLPPPPPNFKVVPAPLALAPPAAPAPSVAQAPSVASTPSAVPVPSTTRETRAIDDPMSPWKAPQMT